MTGNHRPRTKRACLRPAATETEVFGHRSAGDPARVCWWWRSPGGGMGGLGVPYKWLAAIAFVAGLFMDLMDVTIVNVALPTLGRDFGASTATLEWVVTGYLISLAI